MLATLAADAGDLAKRAEARLDEKTFPFFKGEMKDQYPDHVTAFRELSPLSLTLGAE